MISVRVRADTPDLPEATQTLIRQIARDTEHEVRGLLPCLPVEINLDVGVGTRFIPETNELGASVAPGIIPWTINSGHVDRADSLAAVSLRRTLFHELHHQARGWVMEGGAPRQTFMDGPIAEGLATAFERDEAHWEPPWAAYPSPEVAVEWVHQLRGLSLNADYRQWMFFHEDGRRWIGYRAGTFIVDRAMLASGLKATDLVQTPTSEVLALAGLD